MKCCEELCPLWPHIAFPWPALTRITLSALGRLQTVSSWSKECVYTLCNLSGPRTMPSIQSMLDQHSGLENSMGFRWQFSPSEGSSAYNQFRNIWVHKTFRSMLFTSLLCPVLPGRFFTTSTNWEALYDLYMSFISNESFADKQMLVWKCIFLGWKDSNFSEQVQ